MSKDAPVNQLSKPVQPCVEKNLKNEDENIIFYEGGDIGRCLLRLVGGGGGGGGGGAPVDIVGHPYPALPCHIYE
ncbi:hypothetical protein BpHYR1_028560 [Brachionus plicatilis]|uniref:Uncharacterized protein n=1 Tax=Brachionus plicatilis TaxID=10195 RepID=A0A3M7RUU2_BRAPC|nr:hypothetical protein BpHYR1_028560 [Brachionus plicatilis]